MACPWKISCSWFSRWWKIQPQYMLIMPFKFKVYISLIHSTFSLEFPGMVHFALIDRSFDELTTPSLSIDNHVVRECFSCDADIVMETCRFNAGCLSFREFPMWRRGHRSQEKVLVSFFEGRYMSWSGRQLSMDQCVCLLCLELPYTLLSPNQPKQLCTTFLLTCSSIETHQCSYSYYY